MKRKLDFSYRSEESNSTSVSRNASSCGAVRCASNAGRKNNNENKRCVWLCWLGEAKDDFWQQRKAQRSSKSQLVWRRGCFVALRLKIISDSCCIDCKIEKRRRELKSQINHNNACVENQMKK